MTLARLIEAVERAIDPGDAVLALPDQETTNLFYAANRGSIDAAKRLHDALLPGWEWHLGPSNAKIYPYNGSPLRSWSGMADNAARAWLLAILRAKNEQSTNQE